MDSILHQWSNEIQWKNYHRWYYLILVSNFGHNPSRLINWFIDVVITFLFGDWQGTWKWYRDLFNEFHDTRVSWSHMVRLISSRIFPASKFLLGFWPSLYYLYRMVHAIATTHKIKINSWLVSLDDKWLQWLIKVAISLDYLFFKYSILLCSIFYVLNIINDRY